MLLTSKFSHAVHGPPRSGKYDALESCHYGWESQHNVCPYSEPTVLISPHESAPRPRSSSAALDREGDNCLFYESGRCHHFFFQHSIYFDNARRIACMDDQGDLYSHILTYSHIVGNVPRKLLLPLALQ